MSRLGNTAATRRYLRLELIVLKALIFDFGHTVMDELAYGEMPIALRPVRLMPGHPHVLPHLGLQRCVWANTKVATSREVRIWLRRAGINRYIRWIVTSVEAGARNPARKFFSYALKKCRLQK